MNNGLYSGVGGPRDTGQLGEILLTSHKVLSGTTQIDLLDCFNSRYESYRIEVCDLTLGGVSNGVSLFTRFYLNGALDSAGNYSQLATLLSPPNANTSLFLGQIATYSPVMGGFAALIEVTNATTGPSKFVRHRGLLLSAELSGNIGYTEATALYRGTGLLTGLQIFQGNTPLPFSSGEVRVYARQKRG